MKPWGLCGRANFPASQNSARHRQGRRWRGPHDSIPGNASAPLSQGQTVIETDKEHIAVAMEFYVEHDGVLYVPDVPRSEALEPFTPVELDFRNSTNEVLLVVFVFYDGTEDASFGTLRPGEAMEVTSYVGHMWLLRNARTSETAMEVFVHQRRGGVFEEFAEIAEGKRLVFNVRFPSPEPGERVRAGRWRRAPNTVTQALRGVEMFSDKEFPPVDASISGDPADGREPLAVAWGQDWEWERLTDLALFKRPPVMFDEVEPADICQGSLGDCWFLSSVACLAAEFPGMVRALLVEEETDAAVGKATFRLFDTQGGAWHNVCVDDYVPVTAKDRTPCFARPTNNQNELWVPLLEKALAKFVGRYSLLDGGLPLVALACLTGDARGHYLWCKDGQWWITSGVVQGVHASQAMGADAGVKAMFSSHPETRKVSEDELWAFMKHADEQGWLLSASSAGVSDSDVKEGIVQAHAYSLIELAEFPEHKLRLLRTRNPWGATEWKGAWSDESPEWDLYPAVKAALQPKLDSNDGEFWMTLADWQRHFIGVWGEGDYGCVQVLEVGSSSQSSCRAFLGQANLAPFKKLRIEAILAGTDRVVRVVAKQAHRSLQVLEQGLGKGAAFSLQALEQGLGKGAAFSLQTLEQIGRGAQLSWQRINPVALYQLMQNRATLLRPHVTQRHLSVPPADCEDSVDPGWEAGEQDAVMPGKQSSEGVQSWPAEKVGLGRAGPQGEERSRAATVEGGSLGFAEGTRTRDRPASKAIGLDDKIDSEQLKGKGDAEAAGEGAAALRGRGRRRCCWGK